MYRVRQPRGDNRGAYRKMRDAVPVTGQIRSGTLKPALGSEWWAFVFLGVAHTSASHYKQVGTTCSPREEGGRDHMWNRVTRWVVNA